MKVLEVLDNEWENIPINPKKHLSNLKKKQSSIDHRRELLLLKLHHLFPDSDVSQVFAPWRVQELKVTDFTEKSWPFIVALKKLDAEGKILTRQAVSAKINMKYANHDPELALRHATSVRKGRYPEGEDAIASNPKTAFAYAQDVLRGPFPKGEAAIESDPDTDFQYQSFLKRMKLGSWHK